MITTISGIKKIEERFGLPCYVFHEREFAENYRRLETAMGSCYSRYRIAYSYKTNYAPRLCAMVKELGGYAEVVSDMEYDIARRIGYANDRIVYNGPYKGKKLEEHLANGGLVNVDNLTELKRIIAFSNQLKRTLEIGLRVNIDVGQAFISRFGIDADSEDLETCFAMAREAPYLKTVGLHCHVGRARGLACWERRTKTMLELADRYFDTPPRYIDLGSGMFGDLEEELIRQFHREIPTYEDYAKVTAALVAAHYKDLPEQERPLLFTEPGTTLDNRYMSLVARVESIKAIKGKNFAILNASAHNLGDVSTNVKLPVKLLREGDSGATEEKTYDFVGYTCLEHDVLYPGYQGAVREGDYVVFGNVGGYSNVSKPPFILPQCAMVGMEEDGSCYLIKRAETTDDILSTYCMEKESIRI